MSDNPNPDDAKQAILDNIYYNIQKLMAKFPVNKLPDSVLVEVFKRLPADDIRKLRQVCRSWYSISVVAAASLPKRRAEWLDLKVDRVEIETAAEQRSEVVLLKNHRTCLWNFADFSHIFDDMRAGLLIFCGHITFGPDVPIAQYIPSLLLLKNNVQFLPSAIYFMGSDMTDVTEQDLLDCISSFSSLTELQLLDLNNFSRASELTLAKLLELLPQVTTDLKSFNMTALDVKNTIQQWESATSVEEVQILLYRLELKVSREQSVLIKHDTMNIRALSEPWRNKRAIFSRRPHSQRLSQFKTSHLHISLSKLHA
jgi:hypothetical protein